MWMGEKQCMPMDYRQFSRNKTYVSILGKLSEIHLHAWLFSNPYGKVLIVVGISWSPDLRMQHINLVIKIYIYIFNLGGRGSVINGATLCSLSTCKIWALI